MDKQDKKKRKILIGTLILMLCVVLGISYAYLSIFLTSSKENLVKVGDLNLVLDETSSNGITLENGVAITDEQGLAQEGASFSLKNNGKAYVCYKLYLDDKDLSSGETRVDDKLIKFSLDKDNEVGTAKTLPMIGTNPNRLLDEGTIDSGKSISYKLHLWFNSEIDANYSGQVFKGKLRVEATQCEKSPTVSEQLPTVSEQLLAGVGTKGAIDTTDSEQTFITGADPNNYIWYSGKLWRAVSIDPSDNSVKLITQWNISAISYNDSSSAFEGSYMQQWLNDTTVDGFLGNLRDYENFIKTNSVWNATITEETTKPAKTTMVTSAVGLLNIYEYTMSYKNATTSTGYLNNGLNWWALTPSNTYNVRYVDYYNGDAREDNAVYPSGIRPTINLKSSVEIVSGSGTESDPYRLKGDNDTPASGTKLSTRYSGEYIRFGTGENNLYQIVSHEREGLTKIVSATPLLEDGSEKNLPFDETESDANYSDSNTIGTFLNGEYLTSGSYLTTDQVNMIEDNTTWYLGEISDITSYKLAKYEGTTSPDLTYNTTQAKVGLLRYGELNSGQFDKAINNTYYWILTPSSTSVSCVGDDGMRYDGETADLFGIRPTINLKFDVMIISGDGTKKNPFEVALSS